ncbi:MAG TPA: YfdX family protein [Rickettsiales bacterium]|nr:YfdX family protein [Rickettsiales bacterium]
MKTRSLYAYALAACTAMGATQVVAADAQEVTPLNTTQGNSEFEYSARKILGYASEAQAALDDKDIQDANTDLDLAAQELDKIHSIKNYMEMNGAVFGRVFYGDSHSYYIPIADDTYAVRTYKQGPFWSSKKGMAVSDVKLVLVNIAIDPDKSTQRIHNAQNDVAQKDYSKAQTELANLLNESIHAVSSQEQPFTRLQDNIYLTRVLLRQNNYGGARYTLHNAKSALNEYAKTRSEPDKKVSKLEKEIDILDKTIQKRDPSMMNKASAKVEEWWKELKSWSEKNS